ncbi:uncharacterized protein L3040_001191 [Drepanopeziza brunnea f. sp. 'multigermtubi']|uniref:uncharacterized protein n=1 Tax=Drepanopeziza brunnea f. sp. 'multigermtubi' TaxID=698441 RepID=UPI00239FA73F|nr:hypothetical protein L3040_001191 [Drepanopeziza brunnea f. sp. 'multigermtubi']
MMFINSILAAAILAASAVTAADESIDMSGNTIQLCQELDFGDCQVFGYTPGECANIPDPYNNTLSSFDTRNVECFFYFGLDCAEKSGYFSWNGGQGNLKASALKFAENAVSSYKCRKP